MKRLIIGVAMLAVLALLFAGNQASGDVLYSQPARPLSTGGYVWTTQLKPSGAGPTVWDDFAISNDSIIDAVDWYGSWYGADAGETSEPNLAAWTVGIYEDNEGLPGDVIHEQMLPLANVDSLLRGFHTHNGKNIAAYKQSANISPVPLVPGTYWLLTRATLITEPPFGWNWDPTVGSISEGSAIQQFSASGSPFMERPGNRAFTIYGTVVPEPGSLVLLLGALGLVPLLRRRKK